VPGFVGVQLIGAAVGTAIVLILYPDIGERAGDVVVPHLA
jgi:glycerol uptake facilitator-like aquaporin